VEIDEIKVIFDKKSRILDILKMKERRQVDGSVSLTDLYSEYLRGRRFILVESSKMVFERTHITGEREIVRDR